MERLTIDEIIEHCDRTLRKYEENVSLDILQSQPLTNATKIYWEHKQTSEYLKELKQYRNLEESLESIYGDCPDLLKVIVGTLKTHSAMDKKPIKSKLLTDEDVDRWLEYKQLEEQNRLLKLPCKVGCRLYYPEKLFDIVVPVRLNEIIISFIGVNTYSCQYNCCSFDGCGDVYEDYEFDDKDIGKTVFLTESEAEAKLKELRGNRNE